MPGRKIILFSALSIDGRIADSRHGIDFLEDPSYHLEGEDFGYMDLMGSIDTTLMGYNTLKWIEDSGHAFPYMNTENYVFTRRQRTSQNPVTFVNADPAGFCRRLLDQPGGDIWLVGGGQINSILLEAGLIHRMLLTFIPAVLNQGIPLFDGNELIARFKLNDVRKWDNGFVMMDYRC